MTNDANNVNRGKPSANVVRFLKDQKAGKLLQREAQLLLVIGSWYVRKIFHQDEMA